jgi:DNA-binding CsgD family transcriptional regulator
LDISLDDDRCRIRKTPGLWVMGMFRRLSNRLCLEWCSRQTHPEHKTTGDFQSAMAEDQRRPALRLVFVASAGAGSRLDGYSTPQEQETAASDVENLSAREREVLDLVVRGLSNKEIVGRLGISIEGVRWHLRNIYHKLHVHSRTEVLVKFRPRTP